MCDGEDEYAVFNRALDNGIGKAPDENSPYVRLHSRARKRKG